MPANNLSGPTPQTPWIRATVAALCALLVGIGLGRFAFTPILPALVNEGWFTASQAAYLGAANLAGYLAGAVLALALATRTSPKTALRGCMLLAAISFIACASPLPFAWFAAWRFLAGAAGAVLMVLAAPTVMPFVPRERLGLAGGLIFTGVGLGIALSGTLVPTTLSWGLTETWIALGALALVLTAASWNSWPKAQAASGTKQPRNSPALLSLYVEYGLNAMGLVPHMVFWVIFIAQGLDKGITVGAFHWVLFGIGAVAGPVTAGFLADRFGFLAVLRCGYLLQAAFIGVIAITDIADQMAVLALSSLIMGAFVPVCTTLVLGRLRELIPDDPEEQTGGWRWTTITFSIGLAGGAYALSYLFEWQGNYLPLFAVGSGALFLAFVLNLAFGRKT